MDPIREAPVGFRGEQQTGTDTTLRHPIARGGMHYSADMGRNVDIEVRRTNLRTETAEDATHIFAYLTPQGMAAIRDVSLIPLLERGGRLVTYVFSVPGLKPARTWRWGAVSLYLYTSESL